MTKTYSYRPEHSVLSSIGEFVDEHPVAVCNALKTISVATTLSSLALSLSDAACSFNQYISPTGVLFVDDSLATKAIHLLGRNAVSVNKALLIAFVVFVLSSRSKDVIALAQGDNEKAKPTIVSALILIFNNIALTVLS